MLKHVFSKIALAKWLLALIFLLIGVSMVSFIMYGPYYSPDTVNYFNFSKTIFEDSYWMGVYSPLYSLFLHCLTLLPYLSLFKAALLLILIQYGLSLYFLYRLAKITSVYYRFNGSYNLVFLLLILIVYHSWWSFRIWNWAHADGLFYTLLLSWLYFLVQNFLTGSLKNMLILSVLSAAMLWLKLNSMALFPFFLLLLLVENHSLKWLPPLFASFASFFVYSIYSPNNLFSSHLQESLYGTYFSMKSMGILGNNLADFFKSTVGFVFSDVLAAYIPPIAAMSGGIVLISLSLYLAVKAIIKGISISSLFLLFGLIYLLCLLAFQQLILFEEINYRTLLPFFIGCSWYVWLKLMSLGKDCRIPVLVLALLITSHTVLGHFWLWNRKDVNSLFEVEKLLYSDLFSKIKSVQDQEKFKDVLWISDYPAKLALLMDNPFVLPYAPETVFLQGKRRVVPLQEKQRNLAAHQESLLRGQAVLVLFGEDITMLSYAQQHGLLILNYPEGTVLHKK